MFCTDCGREYHDKCNCIYQNKISRLETILLFFFVMIIPLFVNTLELIQLESKIEDLNFFYTGAISLSLIVSILLGIYYIFDKNYIVVFFGCHQKTSRTIKVKEKYLVLCARCTGILIGIYASIVVSFIEISVYWFLILSIPLLVDGFRQHKTMYKSNNYKRLITGFLFGPTLVIIFGGFQYLLLQLTYYLHSVI